MFKEHKPLLKNQMFMFLWASQVLSQVTINLLNFLLLIKLFESTGSSIATSLLWVSYALPSILVGPFAAVSTDIIDRRKLLIYTNILQSLTVLAYAMTSSVSAFLVYGVAMIYSLFNQFYVPSELASLPSLVKKKHLPAANGLFFTTQQVAVIIGFGIAGFLNQYIGYTNSLYLSSLFLFLAFLSVANLPSMSPNKDEIDYEESMAGFFKKIVEGYKYIKNNNNILAPFLMLLVLYSSLSVSIVNIPFLAEDVFNIPVNLAGLALAVPVGFGAATTAIFLPKILKRGYRKMAVIELSLVILTLSLLTLFILGGLMSGLIELTLGIISIYLIGLSFVGILIPTQTYLQEEVPGSMRGRVFGNYWFLATAATIFPVIFSGTMVEILGVKAMLFVLFILSFGSLAVIKSVGKSFIGNGFSLKNIL